jgi:hypothetical protein
VLQPFWAGLWLKHPFHLSRFNSNFLGFGRAGFGQAQTQQPLLTVASIFSWSISFDRVKLR